MTTPRSWAVPMLVVGMLVSGSANSLLTKYQDMQCVENCAEGDARRLNFEQPVWQSLNMFIGEFMCMIPFLLKPWISRLRHGPVYTPALVYSPIPQHEEGLHEDDDDEAASDAEDVPSAARHKPLLQPSRPMTGLARALFLFPATCDIAGTTLMNVGLILTPVSVYQMSRGALVLWVGILSVVFLRRRLWGYQWASLVVVMLGVALVGLAGSLVKKTQGVGAGESGQLLRRLAAATAEMVAPEDPTRVFIGVLLITGAQIFTATQFVVEEKIFSVYQVEPLQAVGLEGFWGFSVILLAMPLLHYAFATTSPYFDMPRGWHQIVDHPRVLATSVAICFSIAAFNLCGLGVTKAVSASARSTIDTCRTLSIWVVSLSLGWEHLSWPFSVLQITGFVLLVYGTFVFNGLVRPLLFAPSPTELAHLPHEEVLDTTAVAPAAQEQGRIGYDVVPVDEDRQ
ncbi:hypothetical protein NliqN6_1705 [Naganishia liquefaciens]|uniref:Integral membrane protein n=1 Tax=Naganishia liquefaciens TaxID=104408 RepID=A0A8H3TQI2_9TREE|nr:hypothetical protein NliqN6_1705 [Naganishia liquefaciens]